MTRVQNFPVLFIDLILYYTVKLDLSCSSCNFTKRNNLTSADVTKCFKEQYPVIARAPDFEFWTGCREIRRCQESKGTSKNPFASRLAEFNTTLKLLRITDQWYIVPVKFRFGRNLDFLALLLLPLAGGPKDWKHFDADWRLISSASFHTSSDNCERNT